MAGIDAHQHFWKYDPGKFGWISDEMSILRNDFMPADLEVLLKKNDLDGCILVQTEQTLEHNYFMLQLAEEHDFIKGIVGWVDLQSAGVTDQLASLKKFKKIKGVRHILQDEADGALMLKDEFKKGIAALKNFNYTYDILIYPGQLKYAATLVSECPEQVFIVDHIAKPRIKENGITEWKKDIAALAEHENVYCKISGMVNEADWKNWNKNDLDPYIDVVVESFGTNRVMFGSDWPVCLVAASYDEVIGIVKEYFSSFSAGEQNLFFGENAKKIYNLI